jgi:hypothetical protein
VTGSNQDAYAHGEMKLRGEEEKNDEARVDRVDRGG